MDPIKSYGVCFFFLSLFFHLNLLGFRVTLSFDWICNDVRLVSENNFIERKIRGKKNMFFSSLFVFIYSFYESQTRHECCTKHKIARRIETPPTKQIE